MSDKCLVIRPVYGSKPKLTEVVFYNEERRTYEILFTGGRCAAKKFLANLTAGIAWENVPAYCQKKARKGFPPAIVLINA